MTTTFDSIRADFELLDDWEDRYRFLIELGRGLEALPESERTDANKVRGCASQVWLATSVECEADGPHLVIHGDSDAHIVKGLIAVLLSLVNGRPAKDILAIDAHEAFGDLGLGDHLTPQRSNGFAAMVARVRADAGAALGQSS
ncbi:MAG: SufE family protein [Hyphomicrobiaceae bacterium]